MASETRVVLVKPGDVLVFGNVGDIDDEDGKFTEGADLLKEKLGLRLVAFFSEDIDLAVVPSA